MQPAKIAARCLKYVKERNTFEVAKTCINGPNEDEVLLRVLATSVNRVDILEKRGQYKAVQDNEILGIEIVGIEVDPLSLRPKLDKPAFVGGIVRGGGYGEFIAIRKDHLIPFAFAPQNFLKVPRPAFPFPEALDYAAVPEAFLTAFQMLEFYGKPLPNEWVYVPAGAGGVGTAAIQLAKTLYKSRVIATCSSPAKAELCRALGADVVINYKNKSQKELGEEFSKAAGEAGVNVILDCIGPASSELHAQIIAQDGRWVLYGFLGGKDAPNERVMTDILYKRVQLTGTLLRNRDSEYKRHLTQLFNAKALPLLEQEKVLPVVGNYFVVDWDRPEGEGMTLAHQVMEKNATNGRVVVGFRGAE